MPLSSVIIAPITKSAYKSIAHTRLPQAREVTEAFVLHYNEERPNQALSCGNQPPRVAFPALPSLPPLPEWVDPDRWLRLVDGQCYVPKVRRNGTVTIEGDNYYLDQRLAGQYMTLRVRAD